MASRFKTACAWRVAALAAFALAPATMLAPGLARAGTVGAPLTTPSAALPDPAPGSKTLDRALTPDVPSGVKNLDALMDLQRSAGADASPAAPPNRADAARPGKPGASATPSVALSPGQVLDVPGRRSDAAARESWNPATAGDPKAALGAGPKAGPAGPSAAARTAGMDQPALLRFGQGLRDFLREQRLWLLGGVATVVALLLVARLSSRWG